MFNNEMTMKRILLSIAVFAAFTSVLAQKKLVLYYSETGTTKAVAQEIQKQLGADIDSIEAIKPYSGNFQETIQRGQREMQSGQTPALKPLKKDLKTAISPEEGPLRRLRSADRP